MSPVADVDTWRRLEDSPFIMGSEPIGRWAQYVAYQLTGSRELALTLPSYFAGLVFVAGAAWMLRERSWLLLVLLAAPFVQFFLGYPATCPLAYAFTGLYLLAGVTDRPLWLALSFLGLACWSHGMALFVAPSALVLCRRRWYLAALPLLPLGLTLLWAWHFGSGLPESQWYGNALGGIFHKRFVHFGGGDVHWHQFTQFDALGAPYWSGVWWTLTRMCPAVFLTPWLVKRDRVHAFLWTAALGCLALLLLWNHDWGFQIDRKFSLLCVPLQILLIPWADRLAHQLAHRREGPRVELAHDSPAAVRGRDSRRCFVHGLEHLQGVLQAAGVAPVPRCGLWRLFAHCGVTHMPGHPWGRSYW